MAAQDTKSKRGRPRAAGSQRSKLERGDAKQLYVVIPADLHKRLKLESVASDESMSELVAEALEDLLAKREG